MSQTAFLSDGIPSPGPLLPPVGRRSDLLGGPERHSRGRGRPTRCPQAPVSARAGDGMSAEGSRRTARLLRLSGRALGAPAHYEPDRIGVCDHPPSQRSREGCVTRATMLAMMFKLALAAEQSFRKLKGFAHPAKIIAGARFVDGVETIDGQELSRAAA